MFHYWQFKDHYYRPDIWESGPAYNYEGVKRLLHQEGLTKKFRHDAMLWNLDAELEFLSYKYIDIPIWMFNIQLSIIKFIMIILQKKIIKDIIKPI